MEIVKMDSICLSPLVLAFTSDAKKEAASIARVLRKSIPTVMDVMGRSLGAQIKAAAGSGADYVAIVGRDEIDCGKLTLRDMRRGDQESLSLTEIEERLKAHFRPGK
jgi:histidyl-tRNA synthetase